MIVTKSVPRVQQFYCFTGITAAGSGYREGDIVTPSTGEPVSDAPFIYITSVDGDGAVLGFDNGSGGQVMALYYDDSPPDGSTQCGTGSGFTATVASGA